MFTLSHFRIPFSQETSCVTISDRILFIPPKIDRRNFTFPGWDSEEVFGQERRLNPIAVEFCSGNGQWILEKAQKNPDWNWVAVEKRFDRVRKMWVRMKNLGIHNLFIVFGEALAYSTSYIPSRSIQSLYINFPDPWPKARHVKNRIISPLLLSESARMVAKEGKFIFVTDDESYSTWFLEQYELWNRGSFSIKEGSNLVGTPPMDYGTSFFDTLFRQKGKSIYYHERIRTDIECQQFVDSLPTTGVLSMNSYSSKQV